MHKSCFRLILLMSIAASAPALSRYNAETQIDLLKGALLGSAVGDALGRSTNEIHSKEEAQRIYGNEGITGFKGFSKIDWLYTENQEKFAPYTANSEQALMVFQALADALENNQSLPALAENIAEQFMELCPINEPCGYDDARNYSNNNLASAADLRKRAESKKKREWWLLDPAKKRDETVQQETSSDSLVRTWPIGLIFAHNPAAISHYTDYITSVTHRHPEAKAASAALANGIAYALQGAPVDEIVNRMIFAAEKYDHSEKKYKEGRKIRTRTGFKSKTIAKNRMLTSDMIRYAVHCAKTGKQPNEILGTFAKKNEKNRSTRGFLLGYEADEAVAAAVYIFVRHHDNLKNALIEGANAAGCSSGIASFVGALIGARTGYQYIQEMLGEEVKLLEQSQGLKTISKLEANSVLAPILLPQEEPTSLSSMAILTVGTLFAGWIIWKYVIPAINR